MIDDGLEHNPGISRQALGALHEGAFGWALSLTGYDGQAAEDVMQQTYLAVLEGKARYDGGSSLKTWLYAVIQNAARRHTRTERLERSRIRRYLESVDPDPTEAGEPGSNEPPFPAIRDAIRGLPRRQRETLELVIDAEFTIEQAARVLGISVGSARTHYHRAKQTLRKRLEEDHGR